VAAGCCLGAAVADTADADALQQAYGVFQQQARNVQPQSTPKTVSTDGWAATQLAWLALFPLVLILRCLLHGWLSVRQRAKHLGELFHSLGDKVWQAYRSSTRQGFAQRLRRLREWAQRQRRGVVLEQVLRLGGRSKQYGQAYRQPQGHRTSNLLDRVMKLMQRYFDSGRHGRSVATSNEAGPWRLEQSSGTLEPTPLPQRVVTQPAGVRFDGWLPPLTAPPQNP